MHCRFGKPALPNQWWSRAAGAFTIGFGVPTAALTDPVGVMAGAKRAPPVAGQVLLSPSIDFDDCHATPSFFAPEFQLLCLVAPQCFAGCHGPGGCCGLAAGGAGPRRCLAGSLDPGDRAFSGQWRDRSGLARGGAKSGAKWHTASDYFRALYRWATYFPCAFSLS